MSGRALVCCIGLMVAGCAADESVGGDGTDGSTTADGGATVVETTAPPTTSTTGESMSASTTEPPAESSSGEAQGSSSSGEEPDGPFAMCYDDVFVNSFPGPNYDGHMITVGSHCLGTNHQAIENVERVVFLGDSITVGTPPTPVADYYRSRLADMLADRFGLQFEANKGLWQLPNPIDGTSVNLHSGDFSSCAKWGARNDDLLAGNQITDCYTEEQRQLTTLTIITSGGNDLANLAGEAGAGVPMEDLWMIAEDAVDHMRTSVDWLVDPTNFPNGHYVVYGNIYEFTDATGEVQSCDLSGLAGFGEPIPPDANALLIVAWMEDQYAQISVETGTDFIFMFEEFCGHGFNADNPEAPCYRGPGNENWFDLTCIHPTPTGHGVLADMFMAVVSE